MTNLIRTVPKGTREYDRDYSAGWRYSETSPNPTLDHADSINASHAWLDGYSDSACGRAKWHLRDCPDHDRTCG